MNNLKTLMLMVLLGAIMIFIGGLVGGKGYSRTDGRGGDGGADFRFRQPVCGRHPQVLQLGTIEPVEVVGGISFHHE